MGLDGVGGEQWSLMGGSGGVAVEEPPVEDWSREALLLNAIREIQEALESAPEGKEIAPRDRISATKSLLALKMQVLEAREGSREDAARDASQKEQAGRIRTLGAALRDARAENEDLRAQLEAHRETQRAWDATAGT